MRPARTSAPDLLDVGRESDGPAPARGGVRRRHAADHRAASATLRDAEARACARLGPDDRDTSPFDRVEAIASVEPLTEDAQSIVAVVTFRATRGLTAEWLQRVVDCQLARSSALGHVVPEMPNCPLVPKGVQARVTSTGDGFAVAIRAADLRVAQEVLARAPLAGGRVIRARLDYPPGAMQGAKVTLKSGRFATVRIHTEPARDAGGRRRGRHPHPTIGAEGAWG